MFKRFLKFFTTNVLAKILAFLFALFVWIYVASGQAKIDFFPGRIPIEAKNIPSDRALVGDLGTCQVKIKAPYNVWQELSIDDFSAFVDLSGLDRGIYKLEVKIEVDNPSVSILEKTPAKIDVKLEPLISKKVPVAVKIEGKPASGFATGEIEIENQEVEARGAKSLVESTLEVRGNIRLNGEASDVTRKIRLTAFSNSGEEIPQVQLYPKVTQVKISIIRASNIKTVGIKVNIVGDPAENYWVSKIVTTPSVAVVSGEPEELKNLEYLETERVDITGTNKNLSKEANLILPNGINLLHSLKKVQVLIYISPNLSTRQLPATLIYKGKIGYSPDTVKVKISGPVTLLNRLNSSDIILNIDLTERGFGDYSISKSDISVPANIEIIDFTPKVIKVRSK